MLLKIKFNIVSNYYRSNGQRFPRELIDINDFSAMSTINISAPTDDQDPKLSLPSSSTVIGGVCDEKYPANIKQKLADGNLSSKITTSAKKSTHQPVSQQIVSNEGDDKSLG